MNKDGRIPIIVGVTGHRDIRQEDRGILEKAVRSELERIRAECPHSDVIVMTCLAKGADQICAETALDMGLEIISVLPMPVEEYKNDFAEGSYELSALKALTERSSSVFIAKRSEPFAEGRDYLYRQAGIYVTEHSHILLALWDGVSGDPAGCGTGPIVQMNLRNSNKGDTGSQLHPWGGNVIQIVTPREGTDRNDAGEVIRHGDEALYKKILKDTDIFNADCMAAGLPDDESGDKLTAVYNASDGLSMINSAKHRRALILLSVCASVLAIAFLLYDEVNWQGMILVCGIMLLSLLVINKITDKLKFHARYLEYRILAELCRVQTYLRTAGISCEVPDIMPWNLQVAIPWTGKAVSAIMAGDIPTGKSSIMDVWIAGQKNYHIGALARTEKLLKRNDRIVRISLVLTIILYIGALFFEVAFCGLLGGEVVFSAYTNSLIRLIMKIGLGAFSALTIFTSNYYGKLALPNVIDDHRKMILLYEETEREIAEKGEDEALLIRVAEDELGENANWYAYQSKHEPELGI